MIASCVTAKLLLAIQAPIFFSTREKDGPPAPYPIQLPTGIYRADMDFQSLLVFLI